MNVRVQIVVACIVLFALIVIINMIREKQLELRYALAWVGAGIGIFILDCFPILITKIAHIMGIASPINMLFFIGFCFSLMVIFFLTIVVSRMSIRIKQLAQELALDSKEKNNKEP